NKPLRGEEAERLSNDALQTSTSTDRDGREHTAVGNVDKTDWSERYAEPDPHTISAKKPCGCNLKRHGTYLLWYPDWGKCFHEHGADRIWQLEQLMTPLASAMKALCEAAETAKLAEHLKTGWPTRHHAFDVLRQAAKQLSAEAKKLSTHARRTQRSMKRIA
ncbi:MAG TPA: hypothetical protein VHY56_09140, partial [Candidatus Binataceae bacterium]|nr:hypothetical protein [Candidatus Binataceae bacterium]